MTLTNPIDFTEDLRLRTEKVRSLMQAEGVQAILLSSLPNLYYLTGKFFTGTIYFPVDGEMHIFHRKPNSMQAPIGIVHRLNKSDDIKACIAQSISEVGLEVEELSFKDIERQTKLFSHELRIHNASRLMLKVRSVKTPWEIAHYREITHRHALLYKEFPKLYRKGMTDLEFQIEMEYLMRKSGSVGIVRSFAGKMEFYMGSLLAGKNAEAPAINDAALGGNGNSALPLGANGHVLQKGSTILADMAGNFSPYQSDMTRTFSLGEIPEAAYRLHELSCRIFEEVLRAARPGKPTAELYQMALEMVKEADAEHYFMGYGQQSKFIGHGVGIQINEQPVLAATKDILEANMIVACEPKFVLPGVGAVGIENTILIGAEQTENLTYEAPSGIIPLG